MNGWKAIEGAIVRSQKIKVLVKMSCLLLYIMIFHTIFMMYLSSASGDTDKILGGKKIVSGMGAHITTHDSVSHMVDHPAFKGFGRYLLPWDNGSSDDDRPLNHVGSLMPYHSHVDPDVVVAAINHMIDRVNDGETIFYDFYSEQQKREDPAKSTTGQFSSGETRELRLPLCAREGVLPMSVHSMKAFHLPWC